MRREDVCEQRKRVSKVGKKREKKKRTTHRSSASRERRRTDETGDGSGYENGSDVLGEDGRNLEDDEERQSDEVGRVATQCRNLLNGREEHGTETVAR